MKYTEEEESWLQSQVHLVDDAYRSVPMGDEILDEIAMFTLGVPLSKSFIKVNLALGQERTWRIFLTQPEFVNLPPMLRQEMKCKVSISSTLNVQIFRTNDVLAAFTTYMLLEKSCRNDVCKKNLLL